MVRVNRSELVEYAHGHTREFMEEYYESDGSKKGYICKLCGSGSGSKGTGITTKDNVHYTCWAGCYTNADIFDLIGKEYGIEDFNERAKKYAELMGIEIVEDGKTFHSSERDFSDMLGNSSFKGNGLEDAELQADYTEYFKLCAARIKETDYHRGISLDTLQKYGIGYDPEWESQTEVEKGKHHPKTKRLIIPTSESSYIARATEAKAYIQKQKVGKVHVFNAECIDSASKPVFIVEGEIDALSIIDVGGCAVGLGSTSNVRRFLDQIKGKKAEHGFIIALDNDEAGRKAIDGLSKGLAEQGYRYTVKIDIWGKYKDANEYLMKDKATLSKVIESASDAELLAEIEEREREITRRKEELLKGSNANTFTEFEQSITDPSNRPLSTGLKKLDALMEGGLYPGLCIIGAMSSAGKTTFALQLADNFAEMGRDVLYYSYEMSRESLEAKSISRLTYLEDVRTTQDHKNAKTTVGILSGKRYASYNDSEKDLISKAKKEYLDNYAEHLYVRAGSSAYTVDKIKEEVREWQSIFGEAPTVIVDYLQIMPSDPQKRFASDKEKLDYIVHELLWLSRECNNRIIVISSFNRAGYNSSAEMSSFKGTGDIEYSADTLLSISEYYGEKLISVDGKKVPDKNYNKLWKESGLPYQMKVDILKQRLGSKDTTADIYGNLMFNWYGDEDLECFKKSISDTEKSDDGLDDF